MGVLNSSLTRSHIYISHSKPSTKLDAMSRPIEIMYVELDIRHIMLGPGYMKHIQVDCLCMQGIFAYVPALSYVLEFSWPLLLSSVCDSYMER